jgi:hypothetical protein
MCLHYEQTLNSIEVSYKFVKPEDGGLSREGAIGGTVQWCVGAKLDP